MKLHINGTDLFFDVYGSALKIAPASVHHKPTLIVLHGGHGFVDHTMYVEFWSQFAEYAQVIFLDQRGCGRSQGSAPETWNLYQWAEDLHAFCQVLNIEKPILAGVSMGGHVLCDYVRHHADQMGGLILCNTEAHFDLDDVCEKLAMLGTAEGAAACREFYEQPTLAGLQQYLTLCVPYYAYNAYSPKELARCIPNHEVFLHFCRQEMLQFDYVADLHKIHCPTLMMVGTDSLHVERAAEIMRAEITPQWLDYQLFERAGSPVYKDQPDMAFDVVKNFLKQEFV